MAEVRNLDLLKPETHEVELLGKTLDLSFMPCGVVFDINDVVSELAALTDGKMEELSEGGNIARKAFELTVKLCAIVTESQYPELTAKYLQDHMSIRQLEALAGEIRGLLDRELAAVGGDAEGKNGETAKEN